MTLQRGRRYFVYVLHGILAWVAYILFRLMGISFASYVGGKIVRFFGPKLKVSGIAYRNLSMTLPSLSEAEKYSIILNMWENLGRVAGEAPHIARLRGALFLKHVSFEGAEHLEKIKNAPHGAIMISGHFGNWELAPRTAYEKGVPMVVAYRPANNPLVEVLYRHIRKNSHTGLHAKGMDSAKAIIRTLKNAGRVGMLVDQKMNDGISAPFFGKPAMTSPAPAELAIKFGAVLIPARVVRTKGSNFRVILYPPLETTGKDVATLTTEINALFEQWIREYPSQWLWMHRRWPDSK